MKRYWPPVFLVGLAAFLGAVWSGGPFEREVKNNVEAVVPRTSPTYLTLAGKTLTLFIADTDEERIRGLGGRPPLPKNTGMLFVFGATDRHGIWMKDMQFPIDILWFDESWLVVDVADDVTPETFPTVFFPKEAGRYVLEAGVDFIEDSGVTVRDAARITK